MRGWERLICSSCFQVFPSARMAVATIFFFFQRGNQRRFGQTFPVICKTLGTLQDLIQGQFTSPQGLHYKFRPFFFLPKWLIPWGESERTLPWSPLLIQKHDTFVSINRHPLSDSWRAQGRRRPAQTTGAQTSRTYSTAGHFPHNSFINISWN